MAKVNALAAGYSAAIISGALMLLLGILGNLGWYMGAVNAMMQWHAFFSLSIMGIIGGILEAAIISCVIVSSFVWVYNTINK